MTTFWPAQPYKGLNYYGPEDSPVFAGRDADVRRCAQVLGTSDTRVVLLHGSTGCGKSSFLRAGLIPVLEGKGNDFQFLRSTKGSEREALFVRSTDNPMSRMAEAIWEFAAKPYVISTADGDTEEIALQSALQGAQDAAGLAVLVAKSPVLLSQILVDLAVRVPRTLVLVLDQAEEVLTLKPGAAGAAPREAFFAFLADFSLRRCDLKVLVSLRTEYYGRFVNALKEQDPDFTSIRDFFLNELSDKEIAEAITRPTLDKSVGEHGSPRRFYGFTFAEGLPERIVADIRSARVEGGILPVLQLVCSRLHKKAVVEEKGSVIEMRHYEALRGKPTGVLTMRWESNPIVTQVEDHLDAALKGLCQHFKLKGALADVEVDIWYEVLGSLVRKQVDGTTTTQLQSADVLMKQAQELGSTLDFAKAANLLADDKERILRRVEINEANSSETIICYSLGHDALGLAIDRRSSTYAVVKRAQFMVATGLKIYAILFGVLFVCALGLLRDITTIAEGIGAAIALLSAGSIATAFWRVGNNRRRTAFLFWMFAKHFRRAAERKAAQLPASTPPSSPSV